MMWKSIGWCLYISALLHGTRAAIPESATSVNRTAHAQLLGSGSAGALQGGLSFNSAKYPFVYRNETSKDTIFGVDIPDPYRWLEDKNSSATRAFVDAQNDLFIDFIRPYVSEMQTFQSLVTDLFALPPVCPPVIPDNQSYVIYQDQDQNFYVQFAEDARDQNPSATLVFNTSVLDPSAKYYIADAVPNADQTYFALSMATNESDWRQIRVLQIDAKFKGHVLKDTLVNTQSMTPVWSPDGKGFFYTLWVPGDLSSGGAKKSNQTVIQSPQVWYHVVGTDQSQDMCLLSFPGNPLWRANPEYTEDNEYLVFTVSRNEDFTQLWIMDSSDLPVSPVTGALDLSQFKGQCGNISALPIIKLVDNFDAVYELLFTDGEIFTVATTLNSTGTRIVRTNVTDMLPPSQWPTLVPADDVHFIRNAYPFTDDAFILYSLNNMSTLLEVRSKSDGALLENIAVPASLSAGAYISNFCPNPGNTSILSYIVSSTTDPGSVYQFDAETPENSTTPLYTLPIPGGYQTSDIVTRLEFVLSKDGRVEIPLLITARRNITLDGTNPTILHAYGGQNIPQQQSYDPSIMAWILGYNGVYAFAAVRGGGELGIDWWNDGHGLNKQHTFDDFISCAEYLIQKNITSPAKLGIQGSSNGGLLMAAVLTQNPGLWSSAVVEAGFTDMLRFPLSDTGLYYMREYGDPWHNETDFRNLLSYSPLHNIRVPNGTHQYPATLITVGDSDDRVPPYHSYKFAAALQHDLAQYWGSKQTNPILLAVQEHIGHAEYEKDVTYVFTALALNATWADPISSLEAAKDSNTFLST
ncbi:Prolyl endopeptidase [Coccomyxa sp. Obi]|nr:Prolyl endopeptidase [Coccomyxa sp. Obi]